MRERGGSSTRTVTARSDPTGSPPLAGGGAGSAERLQSPTLAASLPAVLSGRHRITHSSRPRARLLGAAGAALLAGALALVQCTGGGEGGGPADGGPIAQPTEAPQPSVPDFAFELAGVEPVLTTQDGEVATPARSVAMDVRDALTELYRAAFLDPAQWEAGTYEPVFALFTEDAAEAARGDMDTLTLGPAAGQTVLRVNPGSGELEVRILLDQSGEPVTAVAIVEFLAEAEAPDGSVTTIVSTGQYFLRPEAGRWVIYAYDVERMDQPAGTEASS